MAVIVDIRDARAQLGELLEQVARGDRVTIARGGTPVADLVLTPRCPDDWASSGAAFHLVCYGEGATPS